MVALPRLVIAAPASGHGKTTIATGLMAALSRRGLSISGHKVGPDYIDPGYHSLATGRPGRNLDPHLVGEELLVPLLLNGARGADVAVIEGVMGLYDGQIGGDGFASTAHLATVTRSPIVLVVDISHASRSIGAVVQGMASYDSSVEIAGVILNKAGSVRHADEVRRSIDLPVLGVLHRDDGIVAPSRHLGLVPADERDEAAATLERLTDRITERIDLDAVLALAHLAPRLDAEPWDPTVALQTSCRAAAPATPVQDATPDVLRGGGPDDHDAGRPDRRPVIAMAGGRAFTFRYAETEELLRAAGCDVVTFDPLHDDALPAGTAGLYLGGGFPEVHAAGLSANEALMGELSAAIASGMPTVAECAGLLYLCRTVDHAAMVGALPADARMTPRLTLSYRRAESPVATLLGRPGEVVTGHEFHRTTVTPAASDVPAWHVDDQPIGFASDTVHASYLHTHWAGHPQLAQRFADAACAYAEAPGPLVEEGSAPLVEEGRQGLSRNLGACGFETGAERLPQPAGAVAERPGRPADPLRHHGDTEAGEGLVDFAVNVYDGPRPAWLHEALLASLDGIGAYPTAVQAEHAIARRHGRRDGEVLATAGAAEAFSLIARMRPWRHPVVVHPQFTEPDVALTMAGHRPAHVPCDPDDGFRLDPTQVPDDADLVVIGNPTNPTGALHPAATIRALLRPGRLVVVDEAFMDAVPGETQSLAGATTPGLVVVRSLTKLWSIPGVRAGYVLAEAAVVDDLRAQQVPWSVSTTAAAAMVACCSDDAASEAAERARQVVVRRKVLTDGLAELGVDHLASDGPFVLARVDPGLRARLRTAGFAVRRADTFPGLDETWIRIAVRAPEPTRKLLSVLGIELGDAGRVQCPAGGVGGDLDALG
ncbi:MULTISPECIES: cobyrinate a,c-diamide synthase [unclassified Nocardioides]|uniref:cobyrinate a,c-diamide synthase n=1 Tax=unclassified Nocardioides TaxID=2615069 RepID=UPI0006F429C3|nr:MULTISPECIES: cobyrinate a,c-diamide synthase [unclassified Nocardioides]KQY56373.1 cobyrinic acid a,c-diamide synthase [Nocardioides sp. Root140]KRF14236.1 cobyrinic acid a,c-diamide synthase [Nocardioides sp. Soil796]